MSDTNEITNGCLTHYDNRHIQTRIDFMGLCIFSKARFKEKPKEKPNQECMAKIMRLMETLTDHAKVQWKLQAAKAKEKGLHVPQEPKEYPLELSNGAIVSLIYNTFEESIVRNSLDCLVEIGYLKRKQTKKNSIPVYWLQLGYVQTLLQQQAEVTLSGCEFLPPHMQGLNSNPSPLNSNHKAIFSNPSPLNSNQGGCEIKPNNKDNKGENLSNKDEKEKSATAHASLSHDLEGPFDEDDNPTRYHLPTPASLQAAMMAQAERAVTRAAAKIGATHDPDRHSSPDHSVRASQHGITARPDHSAQVASQQGATHGLDRHPSSDHLPGGTHSAVLGTHDRADDVHSGHVATAPTVALSQHTTSPARSVSPPDEHHDGATTPFVVVGSEPRASDHVTGPSNISKRASRTRKSPTLPEPVPKFDLTAEQQHFWSLWCGVWFNQDIPPEITETAYKHVVKLAPHITTAELLNSLIAYARKDLQETQGIRRKVVQLGNCVNSYRAWKQVQREEPPPQDEPNIGRNGLDLNQYGLQALLERQAAAEGA